MIFALVFKCTFCDNFMTSLQFYYKNKTSFNE